MLLAVMVLLEVAELLGVLLLLADLLILEVPVELEDELGVRELLEDLLILDVPLLLADLLKEMLVDPDRLRLGDTEELGLLVPEILEECVAVTELLIDSLLL